LDSLSKDSDIDVANCNGVKWLGDNLPRPFNGTDRCGRFYYTKAIDTGRGKEVAAAIRSLI